jgi:short-subunit dehydrogenase
VNAIVQQADVGSRSDVKALVERTKQEYGRLDILINNAGIGLFQTITESTSEDIATVMATNFFGALNCIQECVPIMRAQKSGHIVNVSSIIGMHSVYHQGIYAASKAALNRVSESLHAEEGKNGIKVSLVVPERTDTKFLTRVTGPTEKAVLPGGDMRMLTADQVARGIISAVENDQILHYSSLKGRIFGALTGTFPQVIRHVLRPPT